MSARERLGGRIAERTSRSGVDFGYRNVIVRTPKTSTRIHVRLAVVAVSFFVAAAVLALIAMGMGDYPLNPWQIAKAVFGVPETRFHRIVVVEWRMPVAIAAVVFGALLGIGGAIFQSMTRNPLGSPDIIGFDAGSYTAVTVCMLVLGTTAYWNIAVAAIIGGIITAFVVFMLARKNRRVESFRLIIVGIGVSATLGSLNSYLITRADVEDAMMVGFWSAGSINRVTWSSLVPVLILAAVVVGLVALLAPALRQMELGDDAATTQGVNVERTRLLLMVVGVATTALVTAAAGPISFIALVAPQLARRIAGTPGVTVLGAAAVGAALLTFAHFLSLVISHFYRSIPVGLLTVSVGGIYMIWLLIREARTQYGTPK
ncbi:FecCD family ABC transporter permease [Corynebacterium nuruki]|uniref:Iron-enterobactin ABC transporter permease n=1 Tax=Corynebacterium nuruki TaxID=1032851 RepID=A0A3D4SVK7_9CORY|nr:iron chelate uptake ABC transporter family permease subunit [Corynebacterium nuruki]HCT13262.1 iron-enterobactin ABC transporter permease [Corynebacterium nuruki]